MKLRRILSVLLLLLLLAQCALPAWAEGEEESTGETSESTQASESIQASMPPSDREAEFAPLPPLTNYSFPVDYSARARAAILVEMNSGTIIYSENLDERLYPASLTKIMTCMLALEYGNEDDILTVSASALEGLSEYGSTANLQEGEKLPLREVLYCIMVSSANEGCNVIAEYISGSVSAFIDLMNRKAKELGMSATHFANAHGLHEEDHYTTVHDLATLCRWAWSHPDFRKYATTTTHTVPATELYEARYLHTTNYMTSTYITEKYYYDRAEGIKTGFTTPAGGCLASTATSGDRAFLSIVCGCETLVEANGDDLDMRFVESKRLLEFALENYSFVQVLSRTEMLAQPSVAGAAGRKNVVVHADADATVLLPDSYSPEEIVTSVAYDSVSPLEAPLAAGQRVGTVTVSWKEIPIASANLVTLTAIEAEKPTESSGAELSGEARSPESAPWYVRAWYLLVPLALLFVLLVVLVALRIASARKAKKRAEQRRRREERRKQRRE